MDRRHEGGACPLLFQQRREMKGHTMPKRIDSADQLSDAARRCRTAGARKGRHEWPDVEELNRKDLVVTVSQGGKAREVKLVAACKRGCGTVQETAFAVEWKGGRSRLIALDEKPHVKYDDFYLRKPGPENELDLVGIRTERYQRAFPHVFGAKVK